MDAQSAFARYVLNRQLGALALYNPEEAHHECDVVFNNGKYRLFTRNSVANYTKQCGQTMATPLVVRSMCLFLHSFSHTLMSISAGTSALKVRNSFRMCMGFDLTVCHAGRLHSVS